MSLINREALISYADLRASCGEHYTAEDVIMMIKTAPTVEAVHNDMEVAVKDMLCEEFGDIATVKVTKTFADLYRTEDKHETDRR